MNYYIWSFFYRFPFNTKNPIGYFIASICEYVAIITQAFVVMCIICFAVGITLLLISLAEDIKSALNALEGGSNKKEKGKRKSRSKIIMKQLLQLIEFHSNAKELSKFFYTSLFSISKSFSSGFTYRLIRDFGELIQYICLILFTWALVSICMTMLLVQVCCSHPKKSINSKSMDLIKFSINFFRCTMQVMIQ